MASSQTFQNVPNIVVQKVRRSDGECARCGVGSRGGYVLFSPSLFHTGVNQLSKVHYGSTVVYNGASMEYTLKDSRLLQHLHISRKKEKKTPLQKNKNNSRL